VIRLRTIESGESLAAYVNGSQAIIQKDQNFQPSGTSFDDDEPFMEGKIKNIITPPINNDTGASFGIRKPGRYRVDFTGSGGMAYFTAQANTGGWSVNHYQFGDAGFVITYSEGQLRAPGLSWYPGPEPIPFPIPFAAGEPFQHRGGEIRVFCSDPFYSDNVPSPQGSPSFKLVLLG
jgi:hypothetical protein